MPDLRITVYAKNTPLTCWTRFMRNLDKAIERTMVIGSKDVAQGIQTAMGGVRHAAAMQPGPVDNQGGVVTVGIGDIITLNEMTPMKPKYAHWKYGYWFNVEFGREPLENRPSGPWSTQENPSSIIPLALYKQVAPKMYMRVSGPGANKSVPTDGMKASRAIRRGLKLGLIAFDMLMKQNVAAVMEKHGLVGRSGG